MANFKTLLTKILNTTFQKTHRPASKGFPRPNQLSDCAHRPASKGFPRPNQLSDCEQVSVNLTVYGLLAVPSPLLYKTHALSDITERTPLV